MKNIIKKIFILNLIFCLILSNNILAETIKWAPGRDRAKNAKAATNNSNDKKGLQTYFYVPRTGQWEETSNTPGAVLLYMGFNEVRKQKGAYGTWGWSANHVGCSQFYGDGDNCDDEQPHGYIEYFGRENGQYPKEDDVNLSFEYQSLYENPEVTCNSNFKCGSSKDCSQTTCDATINITIDPSPISNYKGGGIRYKGLADNTHMNWQPNSGDWTDADGIYTCPEQNGSVAIADNKKWQNSVSTNISGGEVFTPITTTIEPFTIWSSGRVYGEDEQDQNMKSGENVKALYNNVGLSVAQFDLGNYVWPYFKMKYVDWTSPTKWSDVYCVSAPSRIANPLIVYTATKIGENSTTNKQFTLDIDSQWDGWSQTMEGIDKTGILDANGGDRNCVINGGSTVFVKASDKSNNADKLRFAVTGFIPLYSYLDLTKMSNSSSEVEGRKVWPFCGCDEDAGDAEWGQEQCQQYPFSGFAAYEWAKKMYEKIEKNLGHARIQLMAAEGIYRQGEEHLFEKVAQCVKGANENDSAQIIGGSKAKGAQGTFGSFDGTAGAGKGNKLDSKHEKYNLVNKYDEVDEHNDSIRLRGIGEKYHFYQAWIDTRKDNEALLKIWDYDDPNKLSGSTWDSALLYFSTSYAKTINIRNEIKDKQSGLGQDIDELFANVINSLPNERWKQMERLSGFLTNYLACLDFGCGGQNLRPSSKSYLDTAGHGQTAGWFNEGVTDFGLLEFQFEYELDFDDTIKWLTIDPALCGQAIDQWDLKNWTDGNNDGKKDDDLMKPGALKNKVRTLRFQMSDFFRFEEDEEIDPVSGLGYWSSKAPLYQQRIEEIMKHGSDTAKKEVRNLINAGRGDTDYITTLYVVDIDGSTSSHYGTGDGFDTEKGYPHWLSVPVYLNFNTALKSKFFYLDNSTVQDNYN